ncbi:helix-turn-helix transcriptional regulator [Gilvimarinus sp. SDUM040013]|uniref:Helix-turn-helix transcriptional regulator n=1 Tax=Gilvimarinus gilvus TaxID=3058038 RepID=A0ABU4RX56_9GAMM|nr:helix-turn-helix transcriptional regulator [Gilvimarinus sp. SDUM040013]MDO3386802.1 helix-turn-helix transcriptional regulator [Gilvimarinus sp. SDUM040013]MDX6848268.1 helix-turn-helix transcriptional regulator [Gilvimarinus sp. SDUM040013]
MDSVIFNTHDVVLLMTAYQCVLYALLLLVLSRGHLPRNLFLALFLLSHAAIPLDILINFGEEFRYVALDISPNLFYIFGFAYWLEGPLLLWYTRSALYKNYRPKPFEYLYLAPFLLYLGYEILFYYSLSGDAKTALQQGYDLALAPKYMNYVTFVRELIRISFGVMCVIEIRRYRSHIRQNFSDIQSIDFRWLNLLVDGFLILRVIAVIVSIMILCSFHFGMTFDFRTMGLTANYLTFLLVSVLIFFSLRHSSLVGTVQEFNTKKDDANREIFQSTDIDKLLDVMEQDSPFLQHALTVDELANMVGIPPKTLSAIFKQHFGKNFYEFINSYRIDKAQALLSDPIHKDNSILDILYEAGFNSKATFNTLFKKRVGMTPSEFRKHQLQG